MEGPLALFFCLQVGKMKQAPGHLVELIEPIIEGLGYECVGIEYNPHPKHGLLRIYIDTDSGVEIADCSKVSHQISGMLDVEDPIPGNYQLEVSSPGTDRPLFKLEQFEQFIGKVAQVSLFRAIDNRRKITGLITAVENEIIRFQEGDKTYKIPFQAMSKARLVPDDLVGKGGQDGK
jgi:ribosome maturation factor RimP